MAISIKRLKTKLSEEEYRNEYNDLLIRMHNKSSFQIQFLYEEKDGHDILHLHGAFYVKNGFRYLNYLEKGFNIHITPITDYTKWVRYCTHDFNNKPFNGWIYGNTPEPVKSVDDSPDCPEDTLGIIKTKLF